MLAHGVGVRGMALLFVTFLIALYLFIALHTGIFPRTPLVGSIVPNVPRTGLSAFDEKGYIFEYRDGGVEVPYIAYRTSTGTVATKRLRAGTVNDPSRWAAYYGNFAEVTGTLSYDTVDVNTIISAPSDPALLSGLPASWSTMQ